MGPGPDYHDRLLDALLNVPALHDPLGGPANRTAPPGGESRREGRCGSPS